MTRLAYRTPHTMEELVDLLGHVPTIFDEAAYCLCVTSCADHPPTACSLSGEPHVHPDDGSDTFGACPIHPDAPGDL